MVSRGGWCREQREAGAAEPAVVESSDFCPPEEEENVLPFSDLNPDSHSFLKARPATRRERTAAAAYTDAGGHDTRDLSGIRSRPGLKASRRTTFQEKRRCPK